MLALYYVPAPDHAWDSVRFIVDRVTFGRVVRNLHFFGASFVVVAAGAHQLRSFVFGAYKAPRELTWTTGVLLLLVIMGFALTGYLLPWDQRAYWATTVGTDIAGSVPALGNLVLVLLRVGWSVSGATLGRFYGLHIIVTPLLTLAFMLAYFMMIRKLGVQKPL